MLAQVILQTVVERSLLTASAVQTARETARAEEDSVPASDEAVLAHLYAAGTLAREAVVKVLSEEFSIPALSIEELNASSEALALLDPDRAQTWQALPLAVNATEVVVALANPLEWEIVDHWAQMLGRVLEARLADPEALRRAIDRAYLGAKFGDKAKGDSAAVAPRDFPSAVEDSSKAGETAPVVRYVYKLIAEAVRQRASDIHLEPMERRLRVRFRIDGRLREIESPSKRLQPAIISRLKLMAGISIAEKRIPQDGRMRVRTSRRDIDLRVGSLPSVFGESIVMRILDRNSISPSLSELGFLVEDQTRFERLIAGPDGLILVTGPTGSGKSTTLYAALRFLNQSDRKLITVEDPVEYQIAGVNQTQVRREAGMDFATALRAMLRQAPNIIMIGEIRDRETAEIAMNASLTGHMVFSTLHTNDAPGAVSRLIDIGVKPFLVAASLRAVLAQRLVRAICPECRAPWEPSLAERRALALPTSNGLAAYARGRGCVYCGGIGYRGRLAICELLEIDDELGRMIHRNAGLADLRRHARELGMRTMREDGIRKILAGRTTPREVLAATVPDDLSMANFRETPLL